MNDIEKIHEAIKEDATAFYEMYNDFYKEFTESLQEEHETAKNMAAIMMSFYYSGKEELTEEEMTSYSSEILAILDYVEEHSN